MNDLVTEEHCQKYFDGFKSEHGLDAIFHDYHQGISKPISEHAAVIVQDSHRGHEITGNRVILARKRSEETIGNRGRWLGWWDFDKKFDNVTIDQFNRLANKLGIEEVPQEPTPEPIPQDSIEEYLAGIK